MDPLTENEECNSPFYAEVPAGRVSISIPSRSSICLIDSNTFSPGKAGGGNVGFAIDLMTTLTLEVADGASSYYGQNDPNAMPTSIRTILGHVVKAWRSSGLPYREITFIGARGAPEHIGLASWSAIQAAALTALNTVNGNPLDRDGLLRQHAEHYREVRNGALVRGFTTGLEMFLSQTGGFAFVDVTTLNARSIRTPSWSICIGHPPAAGNIKYQDEAKVLLGKAREYDKEYAGMKLRMILDELIPAVERGRLLDIGAVVRSLQLRGSKAAEISAQPYPIRNFLDQLHTAGVECAFMSSLGPGIVAVSELPTETLEYIMRSVGLESIHTGHVYNRPLPRSTSAEGFEG